MQTLTITEVPQIAPRAKAFIRVPTASRRAVTTLFLVNGGLFATWVSRLPAIESARGMSHAMLGLALFAVALGAMIAMPLAGVLSARIGSDRVCRAAVLVYAGMLPLLALAPNAITFTLALFTFGVGHGSLDVAMNAQAVAVEKSYRRPIMASFHALFSTGGLLGAALGGVLAGIGWTPALHFSVMAVVLGALALVTFRDLHPSEVAWKNSAPVGPKAPFFPIPNRALLALGAIALCVMMGEGAMADWSAVYLKKIVATSEGLAATGYAAFSIAMATGRFFGDRLSASLGPVRLVRGSAALALAGLGLVLAMPSAAMTLVGFALVGLGFASVVPIVFSAAGHRAGINPGVALASVTTLGYLGFLLGPPVIGFAAGVVGLHVALGILLVSTGLVFALAAAVRSAQ